MSSRRFGDRAAPSGGGRRTSGRWIAVAAGLALLAGVGVVTFWRTEPAPPIMTAQTSGRAMSEAVQHARAVVAPEGTQDGPDRRSMLERAVTEGPAVPLRADRWDRSPESRLWELGEPPPPEEVDAEELELEEGEEYRDPEWEWPEDEEPAE